MALYVLDWSSGYPSNLKGYAGAARYIGSPGHAKNLTKPEVAQWRAQGVPLLGVHEQDAGWMLGGHTRGQSAGLAVHRDSVALGLTLRRVCAACDFQPTAAQMPLILACLKGYGEILGRDVASLYGSASVLDAAYATGLLPHGGWQTVAWSGGRTSAHAVLLQHAQQITVHGVVCDVNTPLARDWGQSPFSSLAPPSATPPPPAPAPIPKRHYYPHRFAYTPR